jgi:hypothetical protein
MLLQTWDFPHGTLIIHGNLKINNENTLYKYTEPFGWSHIYGGIVEPLNKAIYSIFHSAKISISLTL